MEDLIKKTTGNLCMMKVFTFKDLRIHIVTYNVSQKKPEGLPLNLILDLPEDPDKAKDLPDFFIIGIQELKSQAHNLIIDAMFNDPWTNALREALEMFGYIRVKTTRLLSMGMGVYCLRKHVCHIRNLECSFERTGAGGLWGNKGGIALRLKIYGAKICFVSSHLHAHEQNLKERIEDYKSIVESIKFSSHGTSTIFLHDYIFWFGDLNFRLNISNDLTAEEVVSELRKGNIDSLLATDQLKAVQKTGEAFSELLEPEINFKPTFKYLEDSSDFDLTRRPAWCDRILYSVNNTTPGKKDFGIKVENYKAIESCTVSDHKPVTAVFTIKVFLNFEEKFVEFLSLNTWYKNRENTATIAFSSNFTLRKTDWIGIFYDDFSCLNEYCENKNIMELFSDCKGAFESSSPREPLLLIFKADDVTKLHSRSYVLLYLNENGDVMGMSSPFEFNAYGEERKSSYKPLDSPEAK